MLTDTVADRDPLRVDSAKFVYPSRLPVWPYTVPHGVW
jgi:hypothetical protein